MWSSCYSSVIVSRVGVHTRASLELDSLDTDLLGESSLRLWKKKRSDRF